MNNKFLEESNQSNQSEQFDYSDFQIPSDQIFNLEDALKGFPVITRKGSEVKIISYNKSKDKIEAHIIRCKSVIAIYLIQNLALSMIIIIDMSHGEI